MKKKHQKDHRGLIRLVKKGFLLARIFLLLMLLGVLQSITSVYSQTKRFNLHEENITIREVLNQIEQQSDYRFFYEEKGMKLDDKLNLNSDNCTIEVILDQLFQKKRIEYKIMGNNFIILKSIDPADYASHTKQQITISGKVTDSSLSPLPGVTVVIKGTTQRAITDENGNYSLPNVPGDATLVFSIIGMETQEVPVSGESIINVILSEESIGIQDLVAVGYGTLGKGDLGGSSLVRYMLVIAEDMQTNQKMKKEQGQIKKRRGVIAF